MHEDSPFLKFIFSMFQIRNNHIFGAVIWLFETMKDRFLRASPVFVIRTYGLHWENGEKKCENVGKNT